MPIPLQTCVCLHAHIHILVMVLTIYVQERALINTMVIVRLANVSIVLALVQCVQVQLCVVCARVMRLWPLIICVIAIVVPLNNIIIVLLAMQHVLLILLYPTLVCTVYHALLFVTHVH